MKKLLFLVAFVCLGLPVFAQQLGPTGPTSETVPKFLPYGPLVSVANAAAGRPATWCTPDGFTVPYTQALFTYQFPSGAPGSVLLTVTGATDGRTFSTVTTASTATGGSISISGVYTALCITATTMTGSGVTVQGSFNGIPVGSSATIDPSGLATSARQVLGGTAGTPSVEVQSIQGAGASQTPVIVTGNKTNNSAAPSTTNVGVLNCVATAAAPSYTEGNQVACSVDLSGGIRLPSAYSITDPCDGLAKTVVSFSISSATTTELLDGSASNYYYVCSFNIVVGGANNVALVDDVDDNCASPASGLAGGVTAATGWNFAANGGLTLGNGGSTVMKTAGTQRRVCLMTSGTAQTSGTITVVAAP